MSAVSYFRENVKQVIVANHLLQKDVASTAGITEANFTRILRGQSIPALDTCEAISKALGIPLASLIDQSAGILSDVT